MLHNVPLYVCWLWVACCPGVTLSPGLYVWTQYRNKIWVFWSKRSFRVFTGNIFFSNRAHELGKTVVAADSFAALCTVVLAKKVLRSASLPRRLLLSAAPSSFFIVQIIACSFSVNYSTCRHTDFLFNNNNNKKFSLCFIYFLLEATYVKCLIIRRSFFILFVVVFLPFLLT